MTNETEAREKFWSALKSDMTVMLATNTAPEKAQPMTAQLLDDASYGPIYFFSSTETDLVRALNGVEPAFLTFVSKGHGLFATVDGSLEIVHDPAIVNALWSPFIAAWFEGKNDPKLVLLRFEQSEGQIWFDANSLLAGIKMLLGMDPKASYKDKTAQVVL